MTHSSFEDCWRERLERWRASEFEHAGVSGVAEKVSESDFIASPSSVCSTTNRRPQRQNLDPFADLPDLRRPLSTTTECDHVNRWKQTLADQRSVGRRTLTRYQQVDDKSLDGVVLRIQGLDAYPDDSVHRARLRRPNPDHFRYEVQDITRPHWPWPIHFLHPSTDDAPCNPQLACNEQPHSEDSGVPSARNEPTEDAITSLRLIEMERLRIELVCKRII